MRQSTVHVTPAFCAAELLSVPNARKRLIVWVSNDVSGPVHVISGQLVCCLPFATSGVKGIVPFVFIFIHDFLFLFIFTHDFLFLFIFTFVFLSLFVKDMIQFGIASALP